MSLGRFADRWLTTAQIALLLIAPIFLLIAIGAAIYEGQFLHKAVQTTGIVVQMKEIVSTDAESNTRNVTYAPVFMFEAAGKKQTISSATGSAPPAYSVGQVVSIVFDPANPDHTQIESWGQEWGLTIAFGLGAVVTGAIGLGMRVVRGPRSIWDYVPFAT